MHRPITVRTRNQLGERNCYFSDPAAWNGLPTELHYIAGMEMPRNG